MTAHSNRFNRAIRAPSLTVLFTSAGRRVELIQCFRADAALLGVRLRCLAADREPEMSAACHLADAAFSMPPVARPAAYAEALLKVCRVEKVDLVVPLLDPELLLLAANRRRFARAGVQVAISAPAFVRMCRNKVDTARHLRAHGVPSPRTERLDRVLKKPGLMLPPFVIKPIDGSGSKGVRVARDLGEACDATDDPSRWAAQELLPGEEYTVNVFLDRRGGARCLVPHQRREVRHGEVSKAVTVRLSAIDGLVSRFRPAMAGARGPVCFQARLDADGQPQVFEINARFGGGFPLAHRAGARFPLWMMQESLGLTPKWRDVRWKEGVTMLRYDQSVFVE